MEKSSLVYGLRLVPYGALKSLSRGTAILKDGTEKEVTMHVIEGTPEEIKNQLTQSLDAFFELLPRD